MNLEKINTLVALLNKLRKQLSEAQTAKDTLKTILPKANEIGMRRANFIQTATSHVRMLESYAMSATLMEDIMTSVRQAPDCSGISSAVQGGIDEKAAEVNTLNWRISSAEAEKAQAEAESIVESSGGGSR